MTRMWTTWCWILMLLVAVFSDAAIGRRGGGGRSGGSSGKSGGSSRGGFHSLPKSSSSSSRSSSSGQSSGRHAKLAGMAAAGAAVGYGLSSLGRSHFSRGGLSSSGGKQMSQPGFQNPNWSDPMAEGELYSKAPKETSVAILLIFSPIVCGVTSIVFQN